MSSFTTVIDGIKDHFDLDWCTESQVATMKKILTAKGPGRGSILNIHGQFGVGKTFLGWILSLHWRCQHTQSIDEIKSGSEIAILDDYPSSREQNRRLLNKMKLKNITQLVVMTEKKIDDDVWSIELKITQRDIAIVRANLFRINCEAPDDNYNNLWELVNSCEVGK